MIDRYASTKIQKTERGVRYYATTVFPAIPVADDDIYIRSVDGERFDLLAYKFYNDSSLWWIIARANNLENGSPFIEPGLQIRIPSLNTVNTMLSELESIQLSR